MSKISFMYFGEHRVQYSSRRADHTFPCPSHVGGTRGVKYPCTSCLEEVVIYLSVFNIYGLDSEVFCSSYKIGSTIRTLPFDFASDWYESAQCYECLGWHFRYQLNVDCPCGETWEQHCPSFWLGTPSSSSSRDNVPGAEHIQPDICKWWTRFKSVL